MMQFPLACLSVYMYTVSNMLIHQILKDIQIVKSSIIALQLRVSISFLWDVKTVTDNISRALPVPLSWLLECYRNKFLTIVISSQPFGWGNGLHLPVFWPYSAAPEKDTRNAF